jgi:hypothetical protein
MVAFKHVALSNCSGNCLTYSITSDRNTSTSLGFWNHFRFSQHRLKWL